MATEWITVQRWVEHDMKSDGNIDMANSITYHYKCEVGDQSDSEQNFIKLL